MTHSEKIRQLKVDKGMPTESKLTWGVLKKHGVERCCAMLVNRKTGERFRCRKAINHEFGVTPDPFDENGSYCKKHAVYMQAVNSKYNMETYE
jgi:hypothetical protein